MSDTNWATYDSNSGDDYHPRNLKKERKRVEISKRKEFYEACLDNDIALIKSLISKGANYWNYGLYIGSRYNKMDVIELMVTNGATDWNHALYGASQGDNLEIIKLMISKGANDWNGGLSAACGANNLEIVKFMITKGALDLNIGLEQACKEDHSEIIELLVSLIKSKSYNSVKESLQCNWCKKSLTNHEKFSLCTY